ncbi:MAG: hypothetical protein KatS3mg028_0560 [Bacteroidia bacterium]|nr:MAG: hypothetical protein KatS3mg028_0560 [Bacteroidia bacterium]
MMKAISVKLFFFLIAFVLLGLFREYVFVNVNNVIYFKYYKNTTMPIPFGFGWLTKMTYATLYYIKYPLTVLFVVIYFSLNFYFLKQMGVYSFYKKILLLAYIFIFIVSAALMLYAYYFNQKLNDDEYSVSRGLMGLAQSPLIGFVLFVLYLWDKNKLYRHEKRNADF